MTKEYFKDDVLLAMSNILSKEQLSILHDVLIVRLKDIEFQNNAELMTADNSNEYYIKMFVAFKENRLSEKTINAYMQTLNKFTALITKPLVNVTANDIELFLMRSSQTAKEVTLNNYRRNLSAFFGWMVKKHIITFNPCDSVEAYKEVQKPIDHLNPEDMEILKNGCAKAKQRALLEFLRCTAVRVGELVAVNVKDIDFSTGKVLVYGYKTKTYRTVMLDRVAMGYIRKYLDERGVSLWDDVPLFASERTGKRLGEDGIRYILRKINKNSESQRRIYPHLFRKSCATSIIRRGGTVGDAGDYLGHSDSTVTGRHYTFKDDTHVENIFNKYVAIV